jgi:hypothetical protein
MRPHRPYQLRGHATATKRLQPGPRVSHSRPSWRSTRGSAAWWPEPRTAGDRPVRTSTLLLALAVLAAAVAAADHAAAEPAACRARIARESARFVQTRMKAIAGCHEFVLKGQRDGPCPDALAAATISKAETKLRTRIAKSCGGGNRTCGDDDDDALAALGWNVGTCPGLHGGGCTDAIADCDDVASCVLCVGGASVDEEVAVAYVPLAETAPQTPVNACQIRIVKEALRLVRSGSKALARCWDAVNDGKYPGPCPIPGDNRAGPALATAHTRMTDRICTVCGGDDGACGGGDDIDVAEIGALASCPDVTPPGGASCAGSVTTLGELVACVDCVGASSMSCADAVAVPWGGSYPPECGG